ncbi:UNC93-like protein 3 [Cucumis sativus]|uniref:UNC93-like protein 3 n=1 Tax=Cucumis sativus TaxID=3659 RepID=UPI0012F51F88|nr:UNC93-like protein 3 [Cucumis sativus]
MDSVDEEARLLVNNAPISAPVNYTRDVHVLSFAFWLIFLAYGAAQNLESTVNTEEDLGTTSLGILYLSFTFFSLVAALVVRALGTKNALILGTTGYWLFIAANLKPTWFTMVPSSVYLGFAASIIWVAQGTYLTSTARNHARKNGLHEGTVIGNFNGEFWAVFASHQVIGNIISLVVLKDEAGGSTNGTTVLFIIFLCVVTLGILLMGFLRKEDSKEEEPSLSSSSLRSSIFSLSKSVVAPLADIRMILTIPLISYSGLQAAFVWAKFTKEVVTPSLGVSGVGGAMAVYGAADAVCSLIAGRLTSGLPSITFLVSGGAVIQAVVFIWLLLGQSETLGTVYVLLISAFLGIGDGFLYPQLNALLGILFKHDMEGAFAQLKVWHSATIAIVFFFSPYISLHTMLVIILSVLCLSYVAFLTLTVGVEKSFSRL